MCDDGLQAKDERRELTLEAKSAVMRFLWTRLTLPVLGLNLVAIAVATHFVLGAAADRAAKSVVQKVSDQGLHKILVQEAATALQEVGAANLSMEQLRDTRIPSLEEDVKLISKNVAEARQLAEDEIGGLLSAAGQIKDISDEDLSKRLVLISEALADADVTSQLAALAASARVKSGSKTILANKFDEQVDGGWIQAFEKVEFTGESFSRDPVVLVSLVSSETSGNAPTPDYWVRARQMAPNGFWISALVKRKKELQSIRVSWVAIEPYPGN